MKLPIAVAALLLPVINAQYATVHRLIASKHTPRPHAVLTRLVCCLCLCRCCCRSARLDALAATCAAANVDEATCSDVTRDTSLEPPELVHIPTCEYTVGRGRGRGGAPTGTCGISGALEQIETCEVNTDMTSCNALHLSSGCIWEPDDTAANGGFCGVEPLYIAAYLPWMCSAYVDDEANCLTAVMGLCHMDGEGHCIPNQAALDARHAEQCTDWVPGSDCAVLGNTCNARGSPDSNLGCCISAIENSGEELCITDWNAFDGHDDCLNLQDESPCMWGYRVQQCADTGIFDECFPTANPATNFGGRPGAGANAPGAPGTFGGNNRAAAWCNGTDDGTGTDTAFMLTVDVPFSSLPEGSVALTLFEVNLRQDVAAALGGIPADNVSISSVSGNLTTTFDLSADANGSPVDFAVVTAAYGTSGQPVAGAFTTDPVSPLPGAPCALNRRRNGCQVDGGNCVYTPPPAPPSPTCDGTDDGTGTNSSFILTAGVPISSLADGSVARMLFEASVRTDVGEALGGLQADNVAINSIEGDDQVTRVRLTATDVSGSPVDYASVVAAFGIAGQTLGGAVTTAPVTPQPGAPCTLNRRRNGCQVNGGNCVFTPAPGGGGFGRRLETLPSDVPEFMRQLQNADATSGLFPETCSRQCQQAIDAAKAIGCMDMPELLGGDLQTVTPEQWDSYGQVCQCQNARGFRGQPAGTPEHLACCDSMTANFPIVQALENDAILTCSDDDASTMAATLAVCEDEAPFGEMICEYDMICPGSVNETLRATHVCMDWVTVDISLIGDVHTVLGSDPSGPMLMAWAQWALPTLMPGLQVNTDELIAKFEGNGVLLIVSVQCPGGVCPQELVAPAPVCRPGDVLAGESELVCEGGPTLPAGGVLPPNIFEYVITNTYVTTDSHPVGWDFEQALFCADLEADFIETGQLMCLLDSEGASATQNAQLMGLATAFRGRGGGGRRQLQFGGAPAEPTCFETCRAAIQPLIDSCLDYSETARNFAPLCAPENVQPGGFDATCLAGVDHLLTTCGMESPEEINGECSQECGGWAGPWWAACRDSIGPLLDAEVPSASLLLEGFIARCPTPCADVSTEQVLQTHVTSALTEDDFVTALAGTTLAPSADITVLDVKHIAVVGISIPGSSDDYAASSTSGALELLKTTISTSIGLDSSDITVLDTMATATEVTPPPPAGGFGQRPTVTETQIIVELELEGSGHSTALVDAVGALPDSMAALAAAVGTDASAVQIVRPAKVHTEVSYRLPEGIGAPDNVQLMMHLYDDTGTLAVVNTVMHSVSMVELRNDGSVCARDGQVCSDAPVEPAPAPADECNGADIDESGSVGVDDLLSLLSMFGRQC
jgi:hypothetical protein